MCDQPRKPSSRPTAKGAAGFTLIEMLVVIAVIMILIAILLPALRTVKITTHRMVCLSQIKQITMGILIIAEEENGEFPMHNSNLTDVSNWNFNLKPRLRSVVPVLETFYCPSTGGKNNAGQIAQWDDPSWDNQQQGIDYANYFNAPGVAFTLRTSIDEVQYPSSEVLLGDITIGAAASWTGDFTFFLANQPFIANHPKGYECVNGSCPGGFGYPPAGSNWGAYDGHALWRNVKELRYLGWGGAGPWQWYN